MISARPAPRWCGAAASCASAAPRAETPPLAARSPASVGLGAERRMWGARRSSRHGSCPRSPPRFPNWTPRSPPSPSARATAAVLSAIDAPRHHPYRPRRGLRAPFRRGCAAAGASSPASAYLGEPVDVSPTGIASRRAACSIWRAAATSPPTSPCASAGGPLRCPLRARRGRRRRARAHASAESPAGVHDVTVLDPYGLAGALPGG